PPDHINAHSDRALQAITDLPGVGSIAREDSVEREQVDGVLPYSCIHCIKGGFRGSGDESENECGHRGDEPDAQPHRVLGLGVELTLREAGAQPQAQQCASKCEYEYRDSDAGRIQDLRRSLGGVVRRNYQLGRDPFDVCTVVTPLLSPTEPLTEVVT